MSLQINDTTYSGTYASYFWLPATFGMDTIQKGSVYVKDGIKKKHTIDRMDFSTPLQERAATPTSSGDFTITGRVLNPADIMLYTEFNPRNFEDSFVAEQLSKTLLAREVPVTVESYMMQIALNRAMEQVETMIWQGSTSYTAPIGSAGNGQLKFFDGFLKKMVTDSAVHKVASPTTLTSSNILAAMDSLITLTATNKKSLLSRSSRFERLKFFVSVNTEQLYQTAALNLTFKGQQFNSGQALPYKGYQVVTLAGLPDNTILFCEGLADTSSNLYVGMNSTEDNQLQLQRLQNNSELLFLKGFMKYDVQYGFSEEVFLYTTLVAADFDA